MKTAGPVSRHWNCGREVRLRWPAWATIRR